MLCVLGRRLWEGKKSVFVACVASRVHVNWLKSYSGNDQDAKQAHKNILKTCFRRNLKISADQDRVNWIVFVYVDIEQTTYLPHVDKRRHLADHPPTSSCLRSYWMTPYSNPSFRVSNIPRDCGIKNETGQSYPFENKLLFNFLAVIGYKLWF